MPKLIVQQGYSKASEIEITDGKTLIGRDTDCEFIIPDGDISRHHSRISRSGGTIVIEDLDSRNGTFVNSARVEGQFPIKHLDVIQVGKTVLVVHDPDSQTIAVGDEGEEPTVESFTLAYVKELVKKISANVEKVVMGKPTVIRNVLVSLISDGHVLIEDVPGVGKSVLAQAIAKSIQGQYKRIQFTPDMLPSDITGISVFNENTREFDFMPGPVFGNVILADEINRTTPRTQSSLLECMTDAVVTVDGKPSVLPKPFFVMATQNPTDFHGTYPLPEAQLDRFLMRLSIGYPEEAVEREILSSQAKQHPINTISFVVRAVEIVQCQALVRQVHVSDPVKEYIIKLVQATREHRALTAGCSPRAALHLMRASQALAAVYGRQYVIPKDIRELAVPALAHRVSLRIRAQAEWDSTEQVIDHLLGEIPVESEEDLG
jgi:MoxR-like ATPase